MYISRHIGFRCHQNLLGATSFISESLRNTIYEKVAFRKLNLASRRQMDWKNEEEGGGLIKNRVSATTAYVRKPSQ